MSPLHASRWGTHGRRCALLVMLALLALPVADAAAVNTGVTSVDVPGLGTIREILISAAREDGDHRFDIVIDASTVTASVTGGDHVVNNRPGQPTCSKLRSLPNAVGCPLSGVTLIGVSGGNDRDTVIVDSADMPEGIGLSENGGTGDDELHGSKRGDGFIGGAGDDRMFGEGGGDSFNGNDGADQLINAGSDRQNFFKPGNGSDLVQGGQSNSDSVDYGQQTGPAVVTLGSGECNDGTAADVAAVGAPVAEGCPSDGVSRDRLVSIEQVRGTTADDDFTGSARDFEQLDGGGGNDRLEPGGGADRAIGGDGVDLLLQRDLATDLTTLCGRLSADRTPGDRAVIDPQDPVDASCVDIERGAAEVPGPVGTPPLPPGTPPLLAPVGPGTPPPSAPDPTLPGPGLSVPGLPQITTVTIPPTPVTEGVPANGGGEGTQPGGGNGGKTAPQLQIISPSASLSRGVASVGVRCVYKAKQCVGTLKLTAAAKLTARKGKRTLTINKGATVANGTVLIPWGKSLPTKITATRALRALLEARKRPVSLTVTVVARDSGAGSRAATATVTRAITLGLARR